MQIPAADSQEVNPEPAEPNSEPPIVLPQSIAPIQPSEAPRSQPMPSLNNQISNEQLLQSFMSSIGNNPLPQAPNSQQMPNVNNGDDLLRTFQESLVNFTEQNPPQNFGGFPQMPPVPPSNFAMGGPPPPIPPPMAGPPVMNMNMPGGPGLNIPPPPGAPPVNPPPGAQNEENKNEEAKNNPAQAEAPPNLPDGIDPEFFNSLPEEYKQELLQDHELLQRNLGRPVPPPEPPRAAENIDTASFLATLTDENLRRDVLLGMDDQTLGTLPENIQAEARRYQRDLQRRQFRRERENDPQRVMRRMLERQGREARRNPFGQRLGREAKSDNFIDIIRRREEKYSKASQEVLDISTATINEVFSDDKSLRSLLRIIIIESQKTNTIKFEHLIRPIENLSRTTIIRSKVYQCFMQLLTNYKDFINSFHFSYLKKPEAVVENIFPPLYVPNDKTKAYEEIHHPKIALLIFKIFNSLTQRYSRENKDLMIAFFSKEKKSNMNQAQTWFTQFDKLNFEPDFIEDSPFLCLLKYILSSEFNSNQADWSEMLKITSNLIKIYVKPLKEKTIEVDEETLSVLFKIITLKIEKELINQICLLFFHISLSNPQLIFENFKNSFIETIPTVKEQLISEVPGKHFIIFKETNLNFSP